MGYPMIPVRVSGIVPVRMHDDDAAFDLSAQSDPEWGDTITLDRGEWHTFNCGFSIEIPESHVGLVCSRSGLAAKRGLFVLNAPGIIDPGYRGDVSVILMNLGSTRAAIRAGDRIAQLLILPNSNFRLISSFADELSKTDRGSGGFGSTGMNHNDTPEAAA